MKKKNAAILIGTGIITYITDLIYTGKTSSGDDILPNAIFVGSLLSIGTGITFSLQGKKHLRKAIWLRNRDVLTQ